MRLGFLPRHVRKRNGCCTLPFNQLLLLRKPHFTLDICPSKAVVLSLSRIGWIYVLQGLDQQHLHLIISLTVLRAVSANATQIRRI